MKLTSFLLFSGALLAPAVTASAISLTENGAPRATIVIPQAAIAPAKEDAVAEKILTAAQDLQTYLRKISGATLPIVGDAVPSKGPLILVGKSQFTDQLKAPIPSGLTADRKEEGFLLQSKGERLVLAGNDAGPYHGTEYAVYEFLNRLGVRWYMPDEYGEVIPEQKTIRFADTVTTSRPDFRVRNWWLHATPDMAALEKRWKIRNKMNPDILFATPLDGSVRNFMAAPELAKTQSELFAKNFDGTPNLGLPNLTNPKAVEIAVQKALDYFKAHPTEGSVGIAPGDGMPRDFSPETVKRNQGFADLVGREGVPTEMSATEEWLEWINAVTRAVQKEMPDRTITTNGYANRNMPPFGVVIDPGISVMFAAIWSDTLHAYDDPKSWQMVRQGQLLKRWCELNDKTWIYGYDYTMLVSGLTPLPGTRKLARDFPLMKQWGVAGFYDETRNIWMERGLTKYVKARLEWDADADVKTVLGDYFKNWYGAAAVPSRAFWEALEEAIESSPLLGHEDRVLPYIYTPELMAKLSISLEAAEGAAATPREKLHVQVDRLIFDHLKAYNAMNEADFAGTYGEAAKQAALMLEVRPKLAAISPFLTKPKEKLDTGSIDYSSGIFYWGIADRQVYYQSLADKISGKTGTLIALLPQSASFTTDPNDEGRFDGWFQPGWDTSKWENVTTAKPFYLQGHMDPNGRPYLGNVWYQFKTAVPATTKGQKIMLYAPTVETEAWVWVNGMYIGHRPYRESYERPNEMELDVTDALLPGKENVISIRVSTSLNRTAAAGGLLSRLFLYSPK